MIVTWVYDTEPMTLSEPDELAEDTLLYYCPRCGDTWLRRVSHRDGARTWYQPLYCRNHREWIVPSWHYLQTFREMEARFDPPELQALEILINTPEDYPNERHSELHQ